MIALSRCARVLCTIAGLSLAAVVVLYATLERLLRELAEGPFRIE